MIWEEITTTRTDQHTINLLIKDMYIANYNKWSKIYEAAAAVETAVDRLTEFGEVKKGDKNTDGVILLQTILRDAGKLSGKSGPLKDGVDGDFGGGTETALSGFIGKTSFSPEDAETLTSKMEETGNDFSGTLLSFDNIKDKIETAIFGPKVDGIYADKYGESIGITDKSAANFKTEAGSLNLPESGPIGNLAKSAWANLNVPTRGISGTQNGNVGCAAAVSIIFYRATGLPIIKGRSTNPIELGTATLWSEFTRKNKSDWQMITDWRNQYQPGDIILTSRGTSAGHVGIVVEKGKVISNSSGGFKGDVRGQIELNYSISGWESVAKRNPQQTALFRYIGPYLDGWGGKPTSATSGSNDDEATRQDIELPEVVVQVKGKDLKSRSVVPLETNRIDTLSIKPIRPSQLNIVDGSPDILGSSKENENKKTE
jgi:hypothetical protein